MPGFDMKDYVPVNERIDQFYRAHPEGSIQSEIVELTEKRVTIRAYAYRKPDDPRPGIGHSSLDIPGATPYTRGSEIENAETSAWGRAIAALGFEVKRGVASAEEVRNKPRESRPERNGHSKRDELLAVAQEFSVNAADLERLAKEVGVPAGERATEEQYAQIIERIRGSVPFPHERQAKTTDALPSEASASAPAAQSTGRRKAPASPPEGSPSAEPTLDDILAATGGTLEQPEPGGSPSTPAPVSGEGERAHSSSPPTGHEAARAAREALRR